MPKIIAHRGLSSLYPENSLIAFQKAIEINTDGVEFDLRRSADNHAIVIHDDSIDRTTTGTGHVHKMSLSEIKKHSIKEENGKIWEDQTIPTLNEVLDLIKPTNLEMRIELKEVGLEELVVDTLKHYDLIDRTFIISFFPMIIKKIKELYRDIKTSQLTIRFEQVSYEDIKPYIDCVDFGFFPYLFSEEQIGRVKSDGLLVDFWTINEDEEFRQAVTLGADYITTDYPQRFIDLSSAP